MKKGTMAIESCILCFIIFQATAGPAAAAPPQERASLLRVASPEEIYSMPRLWHFKAEDRAEYKNRDIDAAGWDLIPLHFSWTSVPKFKGYRGYAWYRTSIRLESPLENYAMLIFRHYHGSQFYINGTFVHDTSSSRGTGPSAGGVGRPDFFVIPSDLLSKGLNTIAIRSGWSNGLGGIGNSAYFGTYRQLHARWISHVLWNGGLSTINLFMGFYFMILFWKRKNELFYLHFSGLAFSLGIWILGFTGLIIWIVDRPWAFIFGTYFGSIIASLMLLEFILSFLQAKKSLISWAFRVFYVFLLAALCFEYLLTGGVPYFQNLLYDPFIQSNALLLVYGLAVTVRSACRKTPYALHILTGMAILTLAYVISALSFLEIVHVEPVILEGFFAMTLLFATALASRFAQVHTDLESAHTELVGLDRIKAEAVATLNIYRHIVSSSRDHMAYIDRDFRIIAANEALLSSFKKERIEVVDRPLEALYGRRTFHEALKGGCEQCLEGAVVSFERWFHYPAHGRRYMATTLYPFFGENNTAHGTVLNARDITERVQLEKEIVVISENERRSIGMQLHDGLAQNLLNIAIKASSLFHRLSGRSSPESAEAVEIEGLLNRAIRDTRTLARGLFPIDPQAGGFAAFSEQLKRRVESDYEIEITVDIDKTIDFSDHVLNTQLYYIIQEAVNNSIKHARAGAIHIGLHRQSHGVVLSIRDNGIGLRKNAGSAKGIGLNIMRYRARMIGAALEIRSDGRTGTEVICRLGA